MKVAIVGGELRLGYGSALDCLRCMLDIDLVIVSDEPGVAEFALNWAMSLEIAFKMIRTDWRQLGSNAAAARNAQMIDAAEAIIFFPGGPTEASAVRVTSFVQQASDAGLLIMAGVNWIVHG